MYNPVKTISLKQAQVSDNSKPINKQAIEPPKRIIIDGESRAVFFILLACQYLFPNGFYLFVAVGIIYIVIYNLQQPLKPGIFTFVALFHFLQIIAGVWLANSVGKDINFRSVYLSEATIATSIGLLFLFFPIYYYQSKLPFMTLNGLKKYAERLSTNKVFNCYLVAFLTTSSLAAVAFAFGGFTQVIISFVKIKWLLFLLFGYVSILKKEKTKIFYLFVLLEFISGFYSFFSEFKTVIYFLVVLLVSLVQVINLKQVLLGIVIGTCLAVVALIWTGIKVQYRNFLNQGTKQQVAAASKQDALNKIYDLSSDVSEESMNSSTYQFLDRLQYTYFFAKTIERVPSVIPYAGGRNWLDNIAYVTTPRILNPNKPDYDATERTKKYTGLRLAGRKSNSSFSLGYFAECYIDFGLWGMMFPLFLIGLMYGITYWYLLKNASSNLLFNYAVVGAFFMEFNALEMDGMLLLGRFLATLVTFVFFIKVIFPKLIEYMSIPQPGKR